MPSFGSVSRSRLHTCHADLQRVLEEVVKRFDITVLVGHRTEEEQEEAYRTGHSDRRWPHSLHNSSPSVAVDVAPWKPTKPHVDWEDKELFRVMGGIVLATGWTLGVELRWGGDWDRDWDLHDQRLIDLPHFELVAP